MCDRRKQDKISQIGLTQDHAKKQLYIKERHLFIAKILFGAIKVYSVNYVYKKDIQLTHTSY